MRLHYLMPAMLAFVAFAAQPGLAEVKDVERAAEGPTLNAPVQAPNLGVNVESRTGQALVGVGVAAPVNVARTEVNVTGDNRPDQWRYKWESNRWWYWAPDNRWMTYSDPGGWTYYEPSGSYTTGYGGVGVAVAPSTTYYATPAPTYYYPSYGYYGNGYGYGGYYGRPGVYINGGWGGVGIGYGGGYGYRGGYGGGYGGGRGGRR